MGDTPHSRSVRRRPPHSRGARPSVASARPPFFTAAEETLRLGRKSGPAEGEEKVDRARFRRLAGLLVCRGERSGRHGDFAGAAYYFELAGAMFEAVGEPLRAADAVLELGRSLMFLRQAELLPALAGRLENLAREEAASLPADGPLSLRVWASILRRAEGDPMSFLHLVQERRRLRRPPSLQGVSNNDAADLGPIVCLPAAVLGAARSFACDGWPLSLDGRWFVHAIEEGPAADRIEKAERLVALGREAGCRVSRQIEVLRVVVKIGANSRGVALVAALRGEGLQTGEVPS